MRTFFLKTLGVTLLFSCGTSAVAGQVGWVTNAKVRSIVATANGGINFRLIPDLSGCVSQSGYGSLYASVYPGNPALKNIQSILLTAYIANKPVAVYISDTSCTVQEVVLSDLGTY